MSDKRKENSLTKKSVAPKYPKKMTVDDMNAFATINGIALNILEMEELENEDKHIVKSSCPTM